MNEPSAESTEYFDVAIIGAGPSGCTCALALRASGLRVVLVDKHVFPRDKICGDAIPGPAFKIMDQLDSQFGKQMRNFAQEKRIHSSQGFAPNGQQLRLHWKTFSYNSERLSFDNFLMQLVREHTKTKVYEGHHLTRIERTDKELICHFRAGAPLRTALVIGCDGANSVVVRELANYDLPRRGGPTQRPARSSAVRTYYQQVAGMEAGVNEFHFFKELPLGYFWIFPLGKGRANVGLGLLTDHRRRGQAKRNLRKTLEHLINNHPRLKARFAEAQAEDKIRGFALPFCDSRRPLSGKRYLLCGDAASLVSPLWGHGIDTGMISGYYAAQQAQECHQAKDFSEKKLRVYDQVIYKKITRSFLRMQWVLRIIRRFPFLLRIIYTGFRLGTLRNWIAR